LSPRSGRSTKPALSRVVAMPTHLQALRSSAERLRDLVAGLDDGQIAASAYPTEWTIADVMSHLGSGAVITLRRLEDAIAHEPTPDGFAPSVWDVWNAKSPRAKIDDALGADRALVERIESLTDDETSGFEFSIGPMTFDFAGFIALRLNEHVLHTWDIDVALDPAATLPPDAAALVVDNLELIGRFTAKPTGSTRTIAVRTTDPRREFTIALTPDSVMFTPGGGDPDLELPAEAFARLVYGRLDSDHTPLFNGEPATLDELRRVYPGP
jgi:uncharacterized protein (TIGR03083 family)